MTEGLISIIWIVRAWRCGNGGTIDKCSSTKSINRIDPLRTFGKRTKRDMRQFLALRELGLLT
jgi:hypothetical protein